MYKIKDELVHSMEERFNNISHQPSSDRCCIYRVPRFVRQIKEEAYTPRVVSIGPFHYGHENLRAMEVHKTRYTQSLFQRTPDPDLTFSKCVEAILNDGERARLCYYGHDHDEAILGLTQRELAEILLVDGCFIIEVLLRWRHPHTMDSVFGNVSMLNYIQRDLVLLENQIPFFVLERVFDHIKEHISEGHSWSLQELGVSFHLPLNLCVEKAEQNANVRHLLDLVRNYYLPYSPETSNRYMTLEAIQCATELSRRGIKFVKGSSTHLFDINFISRNGVLEIPLLLVQDATESLLRNMIAFEQCNHEPSQLITSYAMLMDLLIDTPQDVELLERKGIIVNHLGSGEDVSKLFNNVFKEAYLEHFYFDDLCGEVSKYSNRRWPTYKALLVRNYFSNPWTIVSLLAVLVLLMLVMVQTVFTVLSYYSH